MTPDQVSELMQIGLLIAGAAVTGALAMVVHLWVHWPRDED